jgi:hypothetical protein
MKNRLAGVLPKVHLWTDIVLLNASFLIAYLVRFEALADMPDNRYMELLLVSNLLWVLCINLFKTYQFDRFSYSINRQTLNVLKTAVIHGGMVLAFLYFTQQGESYSRQQFAYSYAFFGVTTVVARLFMLYTIQMYRQAGYNSKTYAVVGKGELVGMIDGFYNSRKELGFKKCGVFEVRDHANETERLEHFLEGDPRCATAENTGAARTRFQRIYDQPGHHRISRHVSGDPDQHQTLFQYTGGYRKTGVRPDLLSHCHDCGCSAVSFADAHGSAFIQGAHLLFAGTVGTLGENFQGD